jgi:hypothetical protein
MNLTGQWLVTRVQADADSGAMRIDVHLYADEIDPAQLTRSDRLHVEARVADTLACREEGDAEPRRGWFRRDVDDGWATYLDIDGTEDGQQIVEVRKVDTLETDRVEARCVLRFYSDGEIPRVMVSRVGFPQHLVSVRKQGELPGVAA